MKNPYQRTITACFTGYIVQAVVNNFAPLLFLHFQTAYHIPLYQITLLVTFNFGIQIVTDLLSMTFVDRIGYRASMIAAHLLPAAGFALLTVLPEFLRFLADWRLAVYAVILVVVMLYRSEGICGGKELPFLRIRRSTLYEAPLLGKKGSKTRDSGPAKR